MRSQGESCSAQQRPTPMPVKQLCFIWSSGSRSKKIPVLLLRAFSSSSWALHVPGMRPLSLSPAQLFCWRWKFPWQQKGQFLHVRTKSVHNFLEKLIQTPHTQTQEGGTWRDLRKSDKRKTNKHAPTGVNVIPVYNFLEISYRSMTTSEVITL